MSDIASSRNMRPRTISLPDRHYKLIKAAARRDRVKESMIIREAIDRYFAPVSPDSDLGQLEQLRQEVQNLKATLEGLMALEVGAWSVMSKGQSRPEVLIEQGRRILAALAAEHQG